MYVTSMVTVQHYFESKRAMATGIAVSGSGVGTLVFGFLTQYLLDHFGWRNCLRIEVGLCIYNLYHLLIIFLHINVFHDSCELLFFHWPIDVLV